MKQNIKKSILVPFVVFTIILSGLLVTWSGFFIKTFLYESESASLYSELTNFKVVSEQILANNKLINELAKNSSDIRRLVNAYEDSYPEEQLYALYKQTNSPFQLNIQDREQIIKHNDNNLYLIQSFNKKNKESLLSINLTKFIKSFKSDSNILGILILNNDYQILESAFNMPMQSKDFDQLTDDLYLFLNDTVPSQLVHKNVKNIFFRSTENSSLIYVATKSKSMIFSVIMQITIGIILVILLSSSWVVIMDLLIIRKMTTSIDILRSVSKKVAEGNFTEKVYIQSSDELGDLALTFNQMVTQLKESTDMIIQQKEQADAIIKCIPDGIIVTDFKHNLIIANKKAEDIFDFKTKDNFSKNISQFIHHSSLQEHSRYLVKEEHYTSEIAFSKESKDFILMMSSTVFRNSKNKPMGIIYLIRDITHERDIEQLREGFLRTVSHELRTPLTSVIGFIELVLHSGKDQFNNEQQSCLNTALDEARTLKELINDLLELSQMQAKQTNLEPTSINVFSFVESITNSLSPLTKGKDLQLINDIHDPGLMMMVDKAKLRRILVNLISNGIKFTKSGFVKVSCCDFEEYMEFCIADTGIGLKENQQEVIFEKFRQIDYSSTREFEGIGLGLSIVKELVELHEGSVRVESNYGQGSSFYFTIKKKRKLTASMVT